jgi:flagellar motility protein MotE (MotC chaperone)
VVPPPLEPGPPPGPIGPAPAEVANAPAEAEAPEKAPAPSKDAAKGRAPAARDKAAGKVAGPPPPAVADRKEAAADAALEAAVEADRRAVAARSGGKSRAAAEAAADPIPPSITGGALKAELAKPINRAEGRSDRARVEELLAELSRTREALRQETARLEAMVQQRAASGGETGGLRMPQGDPLRPGAGTPDRGATPWKGQVDSVSKAMKGMKPEQAAAILARLERTLAAEILRRMPAADAGAVMAQLKPEIAAELATEIATRPALAGKADAKGDAR